MQNEELGSNDTFEGFINSTFSKENTEFIKGKYKILLPEIYGFCGGVISALKKLNRTVVQCEGLNIFLLGEIIHNPTVNEYFSSKNVKIIPENSLEDIYKVASPADIVVIPAFGIPVQLEYKLRKFFHNIVDTTCKNVMEVWNFISDEALNGSTVLIFGKPGHPEVKASVSRAAKISSVIILPDIDAAKTFSKFMKNGFPEDLCKSGQFEKYGIHWLLKDFSPSKFALANQTTMLADETVQIAKMLKATADTSGYEVISCNTICKATYLRQQAAEKLCLQNPDIVFVVGGYYSSNTNHLYELAKAKVSRILYIEDDKALTEKTIKCYDMENDKTITVDTKSTLENVNTVGLLSGASCPFSVVKSITDKLETL